MDPPRDSTFWRAVKVIAILLAVAVVYWPSLRGDFVWDDEQLVTGNLLLRTVSGLGEIWSGGRTADFFPITNTLFWIEWHLFGTNPTGYHIVNIALQAADALLVWLVLGRLRIPGAWLAGFIFAIHPINVESVAWISELKNVLAMFFALLSIFCFLEIEDQRQFRRRAAWIGSVCFFVLALLSKSQAVFVPVVLLLCAWWRSGGLKSERFKRETPRTWPFFAVGLVLGLITIWFQNRGIGEEEIVIGSLGRRLVNAGMAVWWYAAKVIVPARLMVIYPSWRFNSPRVTEWLPLIGLVLVFVLFWFWRNRSAHAVFFALACFVAALAPVLGLVRMAYLRSGTLVADHFVYFSTVPLIALIAATISILWDRLSRFYRPVMAAAVVIAVFALGIYASARAAIFRDEETLWFDTLAKNADAWQAHVRLGKLLFDRQQFAAALPRLQRAVELRPELPDNRNLLGLDFCRLERFEDGIAEYREALRLKETKSGAQTSGVATIRTNLANALAITADNMSAGLNESSTRVVQRYQEAVAQYEKALELEPRQPAIHRNLGMLLARLGRYDEAEAHLRTTLEIVPNEPIAREMLNEIERMRFR
jgi:Flp pilus assembly protein TadD